MSNIIFFDSGPIISLVISRLSWILPELKKKYQGTFYITPAVHRELIERPLTIKRFEFEALQVMKLVKDKTLQVYNKVPEQKVQSLITLANHSFSSQGKYLDIIQSGEMESIACALQEDAQAVVIDERTIRLFIENSHQLHHLLKKRFESSIQEDKSNIAKFSKEVQSVRIIRSLELVAVAYRLGLLDQYMPKDDRETLIDAVLWAVKTSGCAATDDEIEQAKQLLLKIR